MTKHQPKLLVICFSAFFRRNGEGAEHNDTLRPPSCRPTWVVMSKCSGNIWRGGRTVGECTIIIDLVFYVYVNCAAAFADACCWVWARVVWVGLGGCFFLRTDVRDARSTKTDSVNVMSPPLNREHWGSTW